MASTRNKNTPGDYCLQQRQIAQSRDYRMYINGQTGQAYQTNFPCTGINMGHMPNTLLSTNPVEIESALFGINSTNLVSPQGPVMGEVNVIQFLPFFTRKPTYIPPPLVIEANQRPYPIP